MWRRVLSQSPSVAPADPAASRQTRDYLDGWKALGALLHSGGALSGHERNCCFLNTRSERFADASAAVGLDQDADSRGMVATDWDGDGDLDLWVTNRTRPRIRYLQNSLHAQHHYLSVKLRGVTCNRDAIGAKVRVEFEDPHQPPLIKTVSAGEGFVSQGSRWLHFGLGARTDLRAVSVTWPDGDVTHVDGLSADGSFEVTQGNPRPVRRRQMPLSPPLPSIPLTVAPPPTTQRIVLPRRLPLPDVSYVDLQGNTLNTRQLIGQPAVLNLWATWCQPCLLELADWTASAARLQQAGLQVLTLNVDQADQTELADLSEIQALVSRLAMPFPCGVLDGPAVELLEATERSLLLQQAPLPIPTSFLLDEQGRLAVVYKGPVRVEQLLADRQMLDVPSADPRDPASPFRGRWLTDPFPPDLVSIASQLTGQRRGRAAYKYLRDNILPQDTDVPGDTWGQLGVTPEKLTGVLQSVANLLLSEGLVEEPIELYQHAIRYLPQDWDLHVRLASLLIRRQRSAEAIAISQKMSKLRPNHPLPWNNVAWVLATSPDAEIRDPQRAVEMAERVCRATGFREPSALDTLAVAYAANQQFDKAREAAERAIARCRELQLDELAQTIESRLEIFRQDRSYQPD